MAKKQKAVHKADNTDKQEFLLTVAEALFAEHGFDGTSIRMIAEKSGMNVAMISYYFGSKEKMFKELIARRVYHMKKFAESLVQDNEHDPWEKMKMVVEGYVDKIMSNHSTFHKLMMRELSLRKRPAIAKTIEERIMANMNAIHSIVKDGIKQKIFRKEVDFSMMMMMLFGTITYAMSSHNLPFRFVEMEGKKISNDAENMRERAKEYMKVVFARYMLIDQLYYN